MLILLDHSVPRGVANALPEHVVIKARDRGWDTLSNGNLLAAAELAGFEILVTADKNMRYQQNLAGRQITLVILSTPQWPIVRMHLERIAQGINDALPGSYLEIQIPSLSE